MDLRIQKTKAAIKESFFELRRKKPIEKITVTELSRLAGINKATFYLHYSDIYSLADEMEDEVIDDILSEIQGLNKFFDDPKKHSADLFMAFMKNRAMLNYIFSGSRYSQFSKKVDERIKAHLYAEFPKLRNRRNDVVLSFIIQGTFHTVSASIPDKDADYRNKDGFIIEGPEYLTLFNGETGEIMDTVDYDPPRGNVAEWGDNWGNRVDRFLACVAYLDGENPSVVMCRGYYDHGCPTVLVAYDVIDNKLVKRWKFLANKDQNIEYTNQGNHNLGVGDIDGDGLDEIVYGAMAVDHDGVGIYSTGLEHGDCMNLGNFTPNTPNLDFFQIHEHEHAEYAGQSDPADPRKLCGCPRGARLCTAG